MTAQPIRWRLGEASFQRVLLWLCGCLLSTAAMAQPNPLTLQEALRLARQNYPALKAKEKAVDVAREGVAQTRTQRLPSLKVSEQLNYGTTNATAGILLPFGTVIPTTGTFANEASYRGTFGSITTLYSEWAPITFGQYQARLDEAQQAVNVAVADLANDAFTQQVRVTQTYLELLAIERYRQVQRQDVDRVTTLGQIVGRLTKNGLRPGVDTEFANAEVAKAKLALFAAQDREARLRTQLATLLGTSAQNWQLDSAYITRLPSSVYLDSSATLHPQLGLLQQAIRLTDARTSTLRKSYRPQVALLGGTWARGSGIGANGDINWGVGGLPPNRLNYALGIGLTFNILDYARIRSQVRQESIRSQQQQDDFRQARLELDNQVSLADQRLQLAQQQAEQAPVQLRAAARAYRQQTLLYDGGLGDLTALTQALYNLRKAETDQLLITNQAWQTLLSKTAATGDFAPFFNALRP
ncbi:TolC family protein [Fibrella sp. HMF5335]|uniref:TolC family protein n=1 Tax=Fibrella rubiginis TaxID=2817060 RepID=A0A939GMU5_9BACT|nr:TolC family protein [Fibrella rubiginis]MBO0939318.1 TolC family protein [Fibrella rubiginis]